MAKKKATTAPAEAESDLIAKRELFCRYYAQNQAVFCNATLSYAEAYGYKLDELSKDDAKHKGKGAMRKLVAPSSYDKAYNVCAVEGARLLRNPKVQDRIVALLNELLKDSVVDSQLAKLITQDDDNRAKIDGIKKYNKLRGRIIDKIEVTERFAMDDIRELLAPLAQERQDEIYATITAAVAEAEAIRSAAQMKKGSTQQP